jgi:hypothetical protein
MDKLMSSRRLVLWALLGAATAGLAQESQRSVEAPGTFTKYLSPDQVDTWSFEGHKDEVVIAHVQSEEFDPTVAVATKDGKSLVEADDEGSESSVATRLPADGQYAILVHGFQFHGGGNYTLEMQRFAAQRIEPGKPAVATAGADGAVHLALQADKGQILVPDVQPKVEWQMFDPKGRPIEAWAGTADVELAGEQFLSFQVPPGTSASVQVRAATQRDLKSAEASGSLGPLEMDVWSFAGEPGWFRVLEVERTGPAEAKLVYAPPDEEKQQIAEGDELPDLRFFPVQSKGNRLRYAMLLGRRGRYRFFLLARGALQYQLRLADPSQALEPGRREDRLEVGAAAFYTFQASAGQLWQIDLASDAFDPYLRLYDGSGAQVAENDDGGGGLASRITAMIRKSGAYRIQAASSGNGGGGPYVLTLSAKTVPKLGLGERQQGTLGEGAREPWSFQGKAGSSVVVLVRSEHAKAGLELYGPAGVLLRKDGGSGPDGSGMLAVRLPEDGLYTVWVAASSGSGAYTIRLLDAD